MTKNDIEAQKMDLIWEVSEIAKLIGRSERATFHMLNKGELPSARKIGGRWVIERSKLVAVFTGEAA